jgi:hypothetical protein
MEAVTMNTAELATKVAAVEAELTRVTQEHADIILQLKYTTLDPSRPDLAVYLTNVLTPLLQKRDALAEQKANLSAELKSYSSDNKS